MTQRQWWRVDQVRRELGDDDAKVLQRVAERLGVAPSDLQEMRIVRRAVDARGRRAPCFTLSVEVEGPADITPDRARPAQKRKRNRRVLPGKADARVLVLGAGPCGLFAALQLAEAGLRPVLLDRGRPVETRAKDVARLMGKGTIDTDSNLCFGEGGAGTWSDGKLYTRVGGDRVRDVLESIVDLGGPERILVDARPHLGTDRLVRLLKRTRARLEELGVEIRFDARVTELRTQGGRFSGVTLADGEAIDAQYMILAPGHSARDLYRHLAEIGLPMVPKPFALGFRIEHPQALIDTLQYGEWAEHPELPAAFYELSSQVGQGPDQRGVWSFCMCPGGSIVPTPTREGEICVNGMSHAARSGRYANSALVVSVEPRDWRGWGMNEAIPSVLEGMAFQQEAERRAWEAGGGAFVAPAQRLVDYLEDRPSREVRRTTYKRGVAAGSLNGLFPPMVHDALRAAVRDFDRRMRGYISEDAVLVGVETRTSAPVTVLRDRETLQSPGMPGVFPAGEGCGFGGGIVSAAIDGLRVADGLLDTLGALPIEAA